MVFYSTPAAARKSSSEITPSTDWREYSRQSWRSLLKLHFEIADYLRARSSLWGSS
jgi:hypothetical protein